MFIKENRLAFQQVDRSNLQGFLNILRKKKNEQSILTGIRDEGERQRFSAQLDIDAKRAAQNLLQLQQQGEELNLPFLGSRREETGINEATGARAFSKIQVTLEDLAAGNFTGFTTDISNLQAREDPSNIAPSRSLGRKLAPTGEQGSRDAVLRARGQLPGPKPFTPSPASVQNPQGINFGGSTSQGFGAGVKTADGAFIVGGKPSTPPSGQREAPPSPTGAPQPSPTTPTTPEGAGFGLDPEISGLVDPGGRLLGGAAGRAGQDLQGTLASISQDRDLSLQVLQEGREDAKSIAQSQLDIANDIAELQSDRLESTQRQQLANNINAENLFRLEASRAENLQRERNLQQEEQNRNIAARLGINYDGNGIRWMQREARLADETLSFLIQKAAFGRKDFSDKRMGIIDQFSSDMRANDIQLKLDTTTAFNEYKKEISSLRGEFFADQKEARKERLLARQRYFDKLDEVELFNAETRRDDRRRAEDRELELAKEERESEQDRIEKEQDNLATPDDTREYQTDIRKELNLLPTVKEFNDVSTKFAGMQAAFERGKSFDVKKLENNKENFGAVDIAMVFMFQKMIDPGSVVRPSEFETTTDAFGTLQSLQKNVLQITKGGVLTPRARQEIFDLSKDFFNVYNKKLQSEIQPYYLDVKGYNLEHPEAPADIRRIFPAGMLPKTNDDVKKQY